MRDLYLGVRSVDYCTDNAFVSEVTGNTPNGQVGEGDGNGNGGRDGSRIGRCALASRLCEDVPPEVDPFGFRNVAAHVDIHLVEHGLRIDLGVVCAPEVDGLQREAQRRPLGARTRLDPKRMPTARKQAGGSPRR
eukprot:3519798-Pleurochrysis_carterae.AAC.1